MDSAKAFPAVLVTIRSVTSSSISDTVSAKPKEKCVYDCSVEVVDALFAQFDDIVPYSRMTLDFRMMIDRLMGILRNTWCLTADAPHNVSKFRFMKGDPDREAIVTNSDENWYDAQDELVGSMLYSRLDFSLEGY
jgi:hypothetical protein